MTTYSTAQRREIAYFAIARAKVAMSTDVRGYLMTMLERTADACERVGVDAYAATDDMFAAHDGATDYAAIIARAESIVNDEAPVSAVSVGNYRDDSFDVEIVTLAGCSVIGRATMHAAPSRADAESFIARTFGDSFAHACHDGASAHDGYWLA
jgi:hypothetical protein